MRVASWFLVVVTLFLAPPAFAAPKEASDGGDEQTLQMAGLSTDGPALVDFFRHRAHTEADGEHLRTLVRKLGDPTSAVRDRSAAELVGWGPLAVPVLRQAVNDLDDREAAGRARKCLQWIEGSSSATLPVAAARLLAVRKPAGAADALFAYLPLADNKSVLDEIAVALCAVAYSEGKPEAALMRALKDPLSVRRAAAGMALYRVDQPEQWPAVRKLLQDPKPTVRLRAALTLSREQDPEAVGVLIELLADLSVEDRKEAEAILLELAGDWAPGPINGEDEIARRIRRDTWAAWWKNTDGPALVAALKKRTLTPENQKNVKTLIRKLGDEDFDSRERRRANWCRWAGSRCRCCKKRRKTRTPKSRGAPVNACNSSKRTRATCCRRPSSNCWRCAGRRRRRGATGLPALYRERDPDSGCADGAGRHGAARRQTGTGPAGGDTG